MVGNKDVQIFRVNWVVPSSVIEFVKEHILQKMILSVFCIDSTKTVNLHEYILPEKLRNIYREKQSWWRIHLRWKILTILAMAVVGIRAYCREGTCFYFLCFSTISCPLVFSILLFHLFTVSSVPFLPFSGRWHKMTHKDWHVMKQ